MSETAESPEQSGQPSGEQGAPSAFDQKMANVQAALGGVSGNTFDVGEQDSSLSNDQPQEPDQPQGEQGVQSVGDAAPEQAPEAQPETQGENPVSVQEEQPEEQPQAESSTISSPITGEVELGAEKEEAEPASVGFETMGDFEKFLESGEYGITKDNIQTELPKLVEASKTLKEVNDKVGGYEQIFNNIPKPIYDSIIEWSNGRDWRAPVASSDATDYTQDFSSHDSKSMVEKYFPGKITAEEWEEASDGVSGDPDAIAKVNQYQELAKDKYDLDQQKYNQQVQAYEQQAKEITAKMQSAFDASRESVFGMFEGTPLEVQEEYVGKVDKIAQSQQGVLSIFYNADGTLKQDAHERIAMALDGKGLVVQQAKQLEKRAITKARQEVISETPNAPRMKKTGDSGGPTTAQEAEQKAKAHVASILPDPDKGTF